ncbi:hypothetical protein N0V91_007869 [Didymella pomorum]|uniref:PNPLA domain-containing protein n=1 Tax=Didymella pomorum TaxID=749634 RepID=A0A9W9D4Z0_9PLEO|nr:hypothetical protein N0V91_007869 [Didymella pomorum]
MVYTPATKHSNGLRLLALDGGGIRGIVALVMLRELMKRVADRKGLKEIPRPADYFELAAGTSTGGIIGIMLFRLRMTVDDTIAQYYKIGEDVFSPKIYGWNIGKVFYPKVASFINSSKSVVQDSRFDDADLKKAIDMVVETFGLDDNDKALKGSAPLFHPAAGRALAARATSAAPTFFPEVNFPINKPLKALTPAEKLANLVFWDGGLLNNNPIDQLWYARYELVQPNEPPPAISCVISLGTGFVESESLSGGMLHLKGVISSVMAFSTNTNAKGKDMTRHFSRLNARSEHSKSRYIRFQPKLKEDIGLDEYLRMKELGDFAENWMNAKDHDRQKWVDKAVCAICCDGCSKCE